MTQATLEQFFSVWLELGEEGLHWQPCDPSEEETRKRLVLRPFVKLEQARAHALVMGLKRWKDWNDHKNTEAGSTQESYLRPNPVRLAAFLESITSGGATASQGVSSLLK